MNIFKVVAILLIVAGVLGLVFGHLNITKETHEVKVGPIEVSVKDKERVAIPTWVAVGAIIVGSILLLVGGRKN